MKLLMPTIKRNRISFYHQLESTDCAAACIAMIASYYGRKYDLEQIKALFDFTRIGVSIRDILDSTPKIGLKSVALKVTSAELKEIPLPAILYWKQGHFIILQKITSKKGKTIYHIADPSYGKINIDEENFNSEWKGDNLKGVVIVTLPSDHFKDIKLPKTEKKRLLSSPFFIEAATFMKKNKSKYILSIFLIFLTLGANWLIPFLFQHIIDSGITAKDLNIVYSLLIAQLILFISSFLSDFFSNIILTKINFSLSIGLKKSLLNKLMRLPINYFDTRLNTETLQRIGDQNTIQNYITWKGIDFALNMLNIIVFGSILLFFNRTIFVFYMIISALSIIWVLFFLKKRSVLEYSIFLRESENNNNIYEFIMNMPEIKTNNAQYHIIDKILLTIDKLNKLQLRSLFLNMYQNVGVSFMAKLKEILVIGFCAIIIIRGDMTLGALLSISYIIGQLSGPLRSIVGFIRETQDANIANKRIGEIYNKEDEDQNKNIYIDQREFNDIIITDVSFKYPGNYNPLVLNNISFIIPNKKITAIVGASGSGKTTLMKLLLSYYNPTMGEISLDNINLKDVFSSEWRDRCGTVLQDGKLFSGTIAENIVFSEKDISAERLLYAAKVACIDEFILSLPMGFNTKIGNIGIQLSGGETQRILIARSVYRNPEYLFFDEATSCLDAENEKHIHDNLTQFFRGKTVLIIAHRLSTVKNADQIIVLKKGNIIEKGKHNELIEIHGEYYNLIKNQLELGR